MEITDGCSVVHIIQDLLFCDDFHWILESNILITNTVVDLLGLWGKKNRDDSFWWLCEYTKSFTVKSRLSERRLSETTGLFEDDGQSRLFSLLSIAIKLPIIRISIIRKIQFFEVIRRSRLKKLLLNYPSRFEVQKSRMVIMISLFGRVRFTHLSDLAN